MTKKFALLLILIAVIIFLLATTTGQNIWLAGFILPNLLPDNQFRPLETITQPPRISQIEITTSSGSFSADLYLPENGKEIKKVLLTIHGANKQAKNDPRITNFGQTFARAGIVTLIPSFPDINIQRLTPEASKEIAAAYSWLVENYPSHQSGMLAFSVAAGPMFIAAADPSIKNKVDYLISFGGYYDGKEVIKNVTTGKDADAFGLQIVSDQYKQIFGQNEPLNALLNNKDPDKFEELFNKLPADIQEFVAELTPAEKIPEIQAQKILLIHSDPDHIIPPHESVRLHEAFGRRSKLIILKSFEHVTVQLPPATPKSVISYYVPEFAKLARTMFLILEY